MELTQWLKPSGIISSGMSKLPELPSILPYPEILHLTDVVELKGHLAYIIKGYGDNGLSIMINRDDDNVYVSIGDWNGNNIDLTNQSHHYYNHSMKFIQEDSSKFVGMMKLLNIKQLMLYFVPENEDDIRLVDLRSSLNKFYGPGMVKDLFGKICLTQEIIETKILDDEAVKSIIDNDKGSYSGNLILKCSAFKTIIREKKLLPLYAKVIR